MACDTTTRSMVTDPVAPSVIASSSMYLHALGKRASQKKWNAREATLCYFIEAQKLARSRCTPRQQMNESEESASTSTTCTIQQNDQSARRDNEALTSTRREGTVFPSATGSVATTGSHRSQLSSVRGRVNRSGQSLGTQARDSRY